MTTPSKSDRAAALAHATELISDVAYVGNYMDADKYNAFLAGVQHERQRAKVLPIHVQDTLRATHDLCSLICDSPPSTTIKGAIESAAFELGHHAAILKAYQSQTDGESVE